MSNKGDGIGTIFINNKNYKGLKVGTSSVKRKYNIPDENGYTVLKIKCSTGSNILNIFNQLTSNVESIGIFNESNVDINTNTILPNLNVDNNSTNQYTTWTLPNGNYKVFIKGEFSIKDSTCEILKVKLQDNLTTGYKMFYNCNIVKANLDYGIKIPDLMTNTESMFENSNIDHTAEINLLTTTRCSAMYKNCTNLKKIHINYIEAFNNENVLCPNLSESDYDECFFGCGNIKCGNLNSNTNNKPAIFSWANMPYSWGGLESFNTFEIEANDVNGLTLTLVQHINDDDITETLVRTDWGDGTIDNELSHTYDTVGNYIVKTNLQPNNKNTGNYNKLIKKVINVRNDISNFDSFCLGCENLEQFNIDNTIHPTNMCAMFGNCSSLTSIDMTKFDTTNTVNLGYLFNGCTSLSTIIGLENLNAKNVEVIYNAFTNTPIIDADLSKWGCKNISSIYGLFDGCKKLRSVNLTGWDIPNANSLKRLFYNCYELASIKGIEDWDTSNVTDMGGTFRECKPLKTLDLSRWNVSKVESMNRMFNQCYSLETVGDLSNWITPVLTDATYMFNNTKIKSLKLTNFDTSNVTSAAHIFNCGADLEEYDIVITFGDNDYMPFNNFAFCSSIKYITIKGVPDVTRMISFVGILKDQTATGAILDISQLSDEIRNNLMANTTLVDNARAKGWTFRQYSLDDLEHFNIFEIEANDTNGMSLTLYENPDKIGEATTYATDWGDGTVDNNTSHTYSTVGTYTIKTKLQPGSSDNNNNITECLSIRKDITSMKNFFKNAKALVKCCSIPDTILNVEYAFSNCASFNQEVIIPPNVTSMCGTFEGCTALNSNIIIPDGVVDMSDTFWKCSSFNQNIKLPSQLKKMYCTFQASGMNQQIIIPDGVTDMCGAFQQCSSFNQLITIPNSVTRLEMTFHSCTNLNQPIVIPKNVTNMARIFYNCISFNQPIEIPQSMKNMYCAFQGATSFNQDIEIPSGIETIYGLLHSVGNSYNSLITLNFDIEDSLNNNTKYDPIAVQLFTYNSSANRIKICGGINNNSFKILLSQLSNPTTIDIRELSSSNIYDIVLDEEIMNIIDTGKNGTSHILLWADETYSYFVVEPNSNESSLNLVEIGFAPEPMLLSDSLNEEEEVYYTDWGDGTYNTETSHTYSELKTYIVKTKLTPGGWGCGIVTECLNIRNDVQSLKNFFASCWNLEKTSDIPDGVIDVENMFAGCELFNQPINIPDSVISAYYMFGGCTNFNQPITLPPSVENIGYMFAYCSAFNQPIIIPSSVNDMTGTFLGCPEFDQSVIIPDSVIDMSSTFEDCSKLNSLITIGNNVEIMNNTFYNCTLFNQSITIPNSVRSLQYTFCKCTSLNSEVKMMPNSNLDSLYSTFQDCVNFNQPITIPNNVTDMSLTFDNCTSFNQPITIPSRVTRLTKTLQDCTSFNQPFIIPNNITNIDSLFNNCTSFNQPIVIPNSVTYINYMFGNCTSLNSTITFEFNESIERRFDSMFNGSAINSIKIIENGTDTSYNYTSLNRLFGYLRNPAVIDIRETYTNTIALITSNNTLMSIINKGINGTPHTLLWMDEMCNYFIIEPSNTNGMSVTLYENPDKVGDAAAYATDWGDGVVDNNTSHTYSADGIYIIKTKLQSSSSSSENYNITNCLNIRNDITDMYGFFYNLASLTEIPELPSGITSLRDTFFGCTSFNQQVNIPSTVTLMNGTFFECESFNQPVVIPDGVETLAGTLYGCTNFNSSINFGSGVKILDNTLYGCTSFNQSVTIPNSVTNILYLFFGCTSYSSTITFDVLSDSDLNLSNIFTNSTVNNIKFTGELSNTLMTDMLSELVNPTTIDIRELSKDNTNSIVNDSGIMNAVNTGINGTSHILLYEQESFDNNNYNHFEIVANSTNGMSLTLYENPSYSGDLTSHKTDWGDGTIDNNSSHTYLSEGTYTVKTKLQPGSESDKDNINTNLTRCINIRQDITNLNYFFNNCKSLNTLESISLSNLITSKWCFNNCISLVSVDISNFILTNLKNISYMFKDCTSLTTAIFDENTSLDNLENGENVFCNCINLTNTNLLEKIL